MTVDGLDGQDGNDGLDIVWKGDSSIPPANPQKNWPIVIQITGVFTSITGLHGH